MGNYNSQYENYYRNLKGTSQARYNSNYGQSHSVKKDKGSFLGRRIMQELAGGVILFAVAMSCKFVVTPSTKAVRDYCKSVVSSNYDYKGMVTSVKTMNISDIGEKLKGYLEKIKENLPMEKKINEEFKGEAIVPVNGVVTSEYGYRKDPFTSENKFHKGMDLDAKENTDVKVVMDGKVKVSGDDPELGKYVLVDHGKGMETYYGHLNEALFKRDDQVKKGDVIGKSGNTGKSTGPHLHFEVHNMGEAVNPREYVNFESNGK